MAWEENSRICLHMQLIAFLSRIGVNIEKMAEKRGTGMFVYEEKLYFCN